MNSSITPASKRPPIDRQYWREITIIFILSCVSFYTSWDGFSKYMAGEDIAPLVLIVIVAIIQLILVLSLTKLSCKTGWTKKLAPGFMYLISMTLSVFLSYSFYYDLLQASNYANNNFKSQLNNSVLKAEEYKDNFDEIINIAKQLANHSTEKARTEKIKGKTCGDNSKPGNGPRRELRQNEEKLFSSISNKIIAESKKISNDIKKLKEINKSFSTESSNIAEVQQDMNSIIAHINRVRTGQALKQLKGNLQKHHGEARNKLLVSSFDRIISCPDSKISSSIKTLFHYTEELPTLERIELFNPNDDKEVMERALNVFISMPGVFRELFFSTANAGTNSKTRYMVGMTKDAKEITTSDYAPIFLGATVDIFIFLFGLSNGKRVTHNNYLRGNFFGESFSVRDIIKISRIFNIENIGEKLRFHAYQEGSKYYYIIPSETYSEIEGSNSLIGIFNSWVTSKRISKPIIKNIPIDRLPENIGIRLGNLFVTSSQKPKFDFYKLTKEQWVDLEQSINSYHIWKGDVA